MISFQFSAMVIVWAKKRRTILQIVQVQFAKLLYMDEMMTNARMLNGTISMTPLLRMSTKNGRK